MEPLLKQLTNLDISKEEEFNKEIIEIKNILNEICYTKFEEEFSITNLGVSYKLGNDSKIISKIYEIILIEKLKELLKINEFRYIDNDIQNKYPDFIIVSKIQKEKYYAIDIKSSYLKTDSNINGFTLGTYKGYFKERDSITSIVKPYKDFIKHFCVCVIYSKNKDTIPVKYILVREKWEIAIDTPGSGNTCNIGSIKLLSNLLTNKTYFNNEDEFDKFWLNYKC
jgi:hypothetical protein